MFNPISALLGWDRKVRKLRKTWDRAREKSLKKKGVQRMNLLTRLDQIEQNLRLLEERKLGRVERSRMSKEVEIDLEEVKTMVKLKPEEIQNVGAQTRSQAQRSQQQPR